jgi:hypothetical protein
MGYMDLMRARRKSGKAPSLEPHRRSKKESERIEAGLCVKCGQNSLSVNSYLCSECKSLDTIEDIRKEIAAARRNAKNGQSIPDWPKCSDRLEP